VERELLLTGIGGQGIQLAAQVIARAALADGRFVQMFGSYGGMMRGGNTDATIVIGDAPVEAPPTVGDAWVAILMHEAYAKPVVERVRSGGVLLVNTGVCEAPAAEGRVVFEVDAAEIAEAVGNRLAASMVMTGVLAAATGLVGLESLAGAVGESLPPYRRALAEVNVAALRAGFEAGPRAAAPAWEHETASR
jgi:2-oxoacid:acceptor oxidoreductase gamma subunit (pyruvate/2-ketoisovalerate family)